MGYIERIGHLENPQKSEIGGKAYWLDFLFKKGYSVSEGYVLHKGLFECFTEANKIDISANLTAEIFKYDEIRSVFYNAEFPQEMLSQLRDIYESLHKPVIVRSSSSIEDSDAYSCAGLFTSINGVDTLEKFLEAIKVCWISTFNSTIDMCVGADREYPLSLLVQEELEFESGGVAFSINPITGNVNEYLIESCNDGPKAVVSGLGETEDICVSKLDFDSNDKKTLLICNTLCELEGYLEAYVDMEWIYNDGKLYVLQMRPITTIKENTVKYIEVDDDRALTLPLKNLLKIHSRWLEKKIPVRRLCRRNNIAIGKFFYWFRKNDPDGSSIDEIISKECGAAVYEIYDGNDVVLAPRDEVKSRMLGINGEVLRLAESVKTLYSGFSSIIDNKFYIEAAKGGFTAFYSGDFEVTKYVVDELGNIVSADEKYFNEEYYFDGAWWKKRSIDRTLVTLSPETMRKIIYMTEKINDVYTNARIEWILNDDDVYLFDITVEKSKLVTEYGNGNVLSSGRYTGKAKILENIRVFNDEIKHISIRMGYEMNKIEESGTIQSIKSSLDIDDGDVLVCEYPNEKLAVLLDKVKGFVFDRGSLLCHFAIILRERGIPAIIYSDATKKIKNGQMIEIDGDTINIK